MHKLAATARDRASRIKSPQSAGTTKNDMIAMFFIPSTGPQTGGVSRRFCARFQTAFKAINHQTALLREPEFFPVLAIKASGALASVVSRAAARSFGNRSNIPRNTCCVLARCRAGCHPSFVRGSNRPQNADQLDTSRPDRKTVTSAAR